MIAIIDYNTGNLRSLENSLHRLGANYCVTADHNTICKASHIFLPGVGEASSAMDKLKERGLDQLIPQLSQPVLGICIGMQLMCRSSEEGHVDCMGIFDAEVRLLKEAKDAGLKVPHVGWNTVEWTNKDALNQGIKSDEYFYFVHSFAARLSVDTLGISDYGAQISAVLHKRNFYGVQFHPEKSGNIGEKLLDNFLKL